MSKAFRLGVFIVLALLILVAGVYWIGRRQYMFTSTYRLNAEFDNVAGLNHGAEVRVGGIHEGAVRQILLPQRPGQKVRVVMQLANPTQRVIKTDSVATIESEGLVGDKYVEISFGTDQAANVKDGDTILTQPPLQISDLIKKTDGILDSAKDAAENLDETTRNMNSISAKINHGSGTLGALVNDKSMYKHVNAATTELQEDMEALKHNFFLRGFFKRRGYEDAAELKKNEIARLPSQPPAKTFSYDAEKLFDKPDSAELKENKVLNDAGSYLEKNPFGLVVVAASTDMKGDSQKDRQLTEARSMVVRDYLAKNFKFDDTRVKTIGLGKSRSSGDAGKVEVLIYPPGTTIAEARLQR